MINNFTNSLLNFSNFVFNNIPYLLIIFTYLFYVAYTDKTKFIIPQKISLLFFILRFILIPIYPISMNNILGSIIPFLIFWIAAAIVYVNMGGDIKFIGSIGLWLGLEVTLTVTLISIVLIFFIYYLYKHIKNNKLKISYATYYAASFLIYIIISFLMR